MVSVHPASNARLLRQASMRKSGASQAFPERRCLKRIKNWRWWRPIFVIMVSGVTVADQLVASWLVFDYMWRGHWGWFSIAAGTMVLTMTISGLFAAIEDRIANTPWIPKWLRDKPFFIGFFLLYVPFATVKACQAALVQHDALQSGGASSTTRFGKSVSGLPAGQVPRADPLYTDICNRLSYSQSEPGSFYGLDAPILSPQGSLTGPADNTAAHAQRLPFISAVPPASTAAGSYDSPVSTITQIPQSAGAVHAPAADLASATPSSAALKPHTVPPPGPAAVAAALVVPIHTAEIPPSERHLCSVPSQTIATLRARWRDSSILEVRQRSMSLQECQQIIVTVEWMRLVQSLFQDIFTLALQVYIIVLVRQQDLLRFVSIGLGCSSLAINVALMFGDNQPLLRKVVVSFHVAGQLSWRLLVFAYFSVSQAEKAIPVLLVFSGAALVFSIFLHRKSGWVISVVFTFPLWFLAWDTQSVHKSDLFGWKHSSATDFRTVFLRLGVLWRALENVLCAALVLYLQPVNPCTAATSDVRYLSNYCMACCRGPIYFDEFMNATYVAATMYVVSWIAGWVLDNFYFKATD